MKIINKDDIHLFALNKIKKLILNIKLIIDLTI